MKDNIFKRHKKLFIVLGAIAVILVVVWFAFGRMYVKRHFQPVEVESEKAAALGKVDTKGRKVLTVYFTRVGNSDFEEGIDAVSSASLMRENGVLMGNSELLGKMVKNSTGSDLYAISTVKKYPSSYSDTCWEARDEINNDEVIEFSKPLPDVSEYDDVILIYPVWWGTIPNAVKTFLMKVDMSGKTMYLVATHGGSGVSSSAADAKETTNANVSDIMLDVYDDDVVNSKEKVENWLKKVYQ